MTNKTADELLRSAAQHLHEADEKGKTVIPLLQALNEQVQHMQIAAVDMQKAIDALRNEANINGTLPASGGVDEEHLYPAGELATMPVWPSNYGHKAVLTLDGIRYSVDVTGTEVRRLHAMDVSVYWEGPGNYVYLGDAFVRYRRVLDQRISLVAVRDLQIIVLNETHLAAKNMSDSDRK